MAPDYRSQLNHAIQAAQTAGALLRAEFHRQGGPRGEGSHAPADAEAETLIRDALRVAFPDYGVRGEELPEQNQAPTDPDRHLWLIDPNDATKAFLEGLRGSAVSIALLKGQTPVLGVVYAYAAPDDEGDLITWAQGCGPVQRNNKPTSRAWTQEEALQDTHTVLVSPDAEKAPLAWAQTLAPARFRAVPSVAYRLALLAAGDDADLALGLHNPEDLDYAAGLALLLANGGDIFDLQGQKVRFSPAQVGPRAHIIAGAPRLVGGACAKALTSLHESPLEPDAPTPSPRTADAQRLNRAQGAVLGLLCGSALGAPFKNQTASQIARLCPDNGPRLVQPPPEALAGQPCAAAEAALVLARYLVTTPKYSEEDAVHAYIRWYQTSPPDLDRACEQALGAAAAALDAGQDAYHAALAGANPEGLTNTGLVRAAILGVWGHGMSANRLTLYARADAELTHPADLLQDINALFAVTIAFAVQGSKTPREVFAFANEAAKTLHADVKKTLSRAVQGPAPSYEGKAKQWATTALHNAFYQLLTASNLPSGLVDTVRRGGDVEHNAAICGALLGAVYGARTLPGQWADRVLSCRPAEDLPDVFVARPKSVWPTNALALAEGLLAATAQ